MNTYKGGDINLGGKSEFWGTVLVGNEIYSGANVKIHGFFIALGWNDDETYESVTNTFGGDLDIIYENVPDTFDRTIPSAATECQLNPDSELCPYAPPIKEFDQNSVNATIKWSRYL